MFKDNIGLYAAALRVLVALPEKRLFKRTMAVDNYQAIFVIKQNTGDVSMVVKLTN